MVERSCPEPSDATLELVGLVCLRDPLPLYTCPRNHVALNDWAQRMARLAHHYHGHHVLPRTGGVEDQDAKTMDAVERCCSFIGALERVEARKSRADAQRQAEQHANPRVRYGEGIDARHEEAPHLRGARR